MFVRFSYNKHLLVLSCLVVRLSVCRHVSADPTGRIFVKFDNRDCYENLLINSAFR